MHDSNMKLRIAHINQLLAYVENRDREGWYYGNREQFEKRHREILEFLRGFLSDGKERFTQDSQV